MNEKATGDSLARTTPKEIAEDEDEDEDEDEGEGEGEKDHDHGEARLKGIKVRTPFRAPVLRHNPRFFNQR